MFVKPLIILVLVGQSLCYSWSEEAKNFNNLCRKVNRAYQVNKLDFSEINDRLDTCLNAHINESGLKSYVLKPLTEKSYNINNAYKNTFQQVSCTVDNFHNFIYCMERLLK
ncbi:uncharacterized protein LOC126264882 [Aethina tumida]|uniref:uncharacterized protein LOC126264882 n=1 Tax=Aethina tumida TaxID=116153 RepID=UPI00214780CF|nr:uncharacterized protein LOC126264882 [Aethina tumida]